MCSSIVEVSWHRLRDQWILYASFDGLYSGLFAEGDVKISWRVSHAKGHVRREQKKLIITQQSSLIDQLTTNLS